MLQTIYYHAFVRNVVEWYSYFTWLKMKR